MSTEYYTIPKETRNKIKSRIQSNFGIIRKIANLGIEDLTELLDVSRQSVYNIEKGKTSLSDPQMTVLLLTLEKISDGNETLKSMLNKILDIEDDDWFDEVDKEYKSQTQSTTENVISNGAGILVGATIAGTLARTIGGATLGPLGVVAGSLMSSWLADKVSKTKSEEKGKTGSDK